MDVLNAIELYLKMVNSRDFAGGLVVKTLYFHYRGCVLSLVGEQRWCVAETKKEKLNGNFYAVLFCYNFKIFQLFENQRCQSLLHKYREVVAREVW